MEFTTKLAGTAIIGLGYVGLPLALALSASGKVVVGIDIDQKKIEKLERGESYLKHFDDQSIKSALSRGDFRVSTDFQMLETVENIIICVPTPLTKHQEPDLSAILSTAKSISPFLQKDQLVVLESSTFPGTTWEYLRPILEESGLRADIDFYLAYSPEREDPGNLEFDTSSIPKVVGANNRVSLERACGLYSEFIKQVVPVSDLKAAEATKITENVFRSVNIALVNELKEIFDSMDIDVWEVIDAASTKPFGFMPFYPGPGLGGHCIPIDPFYLTWKAKEFGLRTRFIELAGEVNSRAPSFVVKKTTEALGRISQRSVSGSKLLILGLAYKRDIDDMRESPSIKLMQMFERLGASVEYHDPHILEIPNTREHPEFMGRKSVDLSKDKLASIDAVILTTDHSAVNYEFIGNNSKIIIDTRNQYADISCSASVIKA